MTIIEGVDYAFSRPPAAALVAAGKHFACRYGGPGSAGKQLTEAELASLTEHGIAVVANAEGSAGGFKGATAGRSWAQSALAHFDALGMPDDRPIYFSVDWPAGPADWPGVDAALRGAAAVLGPARVGVYGSYAVIAHCAAEGTAAWLWQTYAWSAGLWHQAAHLQQYRNDVTVGGATCDLTRALQSDYGQWGVDVAISAEDRAAIAQAVASKLYADLGNPASGLAKLQTASEQRIIAGVTAKVGTVTITPEQLQAAVLGALKELAGASPAGS